MKLRKLLVLLLLLGAAFVLSACADPGEKGATGQTGATGDSGVAGDKGPTGDKGVTGDKGATGDKGEDGTNGVGIEFLTNSDGIVWRYVGETDADWKVGVTYADIFKAISDNKVGDKVKAFGFDYYVGADVAELAADASVEVFGETLKKGETAFATIAEAFAAAKVASAATDYAGLKIYVAAGTYNEYVNLEAAKVTLFGPNVNMDPNEVARNTEAILTGSIRVSADEFTINGISFGGTPQSVAADGTIDPEGTATEFGKTNLQVEADNIKILYCDTDESSMKSYMLNFTDVDGLELGNSRIFPRHAGYDLRPIRGVTGTQKNINIHDCYILNTCAAGAVCDAIRFNNIAGTLTIKNTVCDWSSNNWGFFLGSSSNACTKIDLIGVTMECSDTTAYNSGITIRNTEDMPENAEINLKYIYFGNVSGTNLQLRATNNTYASGTTLKINLQYLAYQNANTYINATDSLMPFITLSDSYFAETLALHCAPATLTCTNQITDFSDVPSVPAE